MAGVCKGGEVMTDKRLSDILAIKNQIGVNNFLISSIMDDIKKPDLKYSQFGISFENAEMAERFLALLVEYNNELETKFKLM